MIDFKNKTAFIAIIIMLTVFSGSSSIVNAGSSDINQNSNSDETGNLTEPIVDEKTIIAAFDLGYQHFTKGNYSEACPLFFFFLERKTPDDKDYEWARFFFGICLRKMGYSHASVDVLANLVVTKPNPRIVNYTLELFEEIMRDLPFDRDLVINKAICDQDYGFVEGNISDFVNYYQGVYAWEHGFIEWGLDHFSKVNPKSQYYYKYLYKTALFKIYQGKLDHAVDILKQIRQESDPSGELNNEIRKTLARLLYEKGKYRESDDLYSEIEKSIRLQSRNFLERAWAHYRMENPEKSMGLLYAFEAPSFQNYFTPEYYMLKSFIYKDVCHYKRAMTVVHDFRERYGDSLENIYKRGAPEDNSALMLVILNKAKVNRTWNFLELLSRERLEIANITDSKLKTHLEKIYDLQITKSKAELRLKVDEEYEKIANELLRYEENAHLMEYEIGLDMYQRVYQYHYDEENEDVSGKKKGNKGKVVYKFQGEFWNDELATYEVILPNKCNSMEEWDIFFK